MNTSPYRSSGQPALWALLALAASACGPPPEAGRVQATYDEQTGRLRQLTVDASKDGKPNIFSYMDATRLMRIEIDNNEDGLIDRWEYYGADQKLEKVGFSKANDGTVDSWAYQGADGKIVRVEVSTRRDGKVTRTEFYEKDALARAEEDTNGDGRVDKWETYDEGGAITSVAFDTEGRGAPDRRVEYGRDGSVKRLSP